MLDPVRRALATVASILIALALFPLPAARAQAPTAPPVGGIVPPASYPKWKTPISVPPLRAIDISPDGKRIALLTDDGKIAVWSASGDPLWSVTGQSVDRIRITAGNPGYLIAYRYLDPMDCTVTFFNAANGKRVLTRAVDGAIWNMAASASGKYAAFGTGAGSLYIFTLTQHPSVHRLDLRGLADSVDWADDDSFLAAGLWNGSGVSVFDPSGDVKWDIAGKADRRYDVAVTHGSKFVLATSYYNHDRTHPVLTLRQRTGKPVWSYDLGPDVSHIFAATTSDGSVTIASFTRRVHRGSDITLERRMLALDRMGLPLWGTEYGGPYLSPVFVCFTPAEDGIVYYDSDLRLYRMTMNHFQTGMKLLTQPIRSMVATPDGRLLLVNTVDDHLLLLSTP